MPSKKLCLLLFLVSTPALAKTRNFVTSSSFGFSFSAGLTNNPFINFVPEPLAYKSNFTPFYTMTPGFDFGNFSIEAALAWYAHPSISATNAIYSETVASNTFAASGRFRFFPTYWGARRGRAYFGFSYGEGYSYLTNKSKYTSGAAYTERLKGASAIFNGFIGAENFLFQNYVGGIEMGYRNFLADNLKFNGDTDSSGAAVNKGEIKETSTGRKSFLEFRGFYLQLHLGVHF